MFEVVRDLQRYLVQQSDSLCVTHDISATRSGDSFLAMTVHTIDKNTFEPESHVTHLVHLKARHTVDALAQIVANRIDDITRDDQILYSQNTDGALAARGLAKEVARLIQEKTSVTADEDDYDADEDAHDDGEALLDEKLETSTCGIHSMALVFKDAEKPPESWKTGDPPPPVTAAFAAIAKVFVAIKRSNVCLRALLNAQELAQHPKLRPILPCTTRFLSKHDMADRYTAVHDDIVVLALTNSLKTDSDDPMEDARPLTEEELALFKAVVRFSKPLRCALTEYQADQYLVIHRLPVDVHHWIQMADVAVTKAKDAVPPPALQYLKKLAAAAKTRFKEHLEPNSPASLCAALHPESYHETAATFGDEHMMKSFQRILQWYEHLCPPPLVGEAGAMPAGGDFGVATSDVSPETLKAWHRNQLILELGRFKAKLVSQPKPGVGEKRKNSRSALLDFYGSASEGFKKLIGAVFCWQFASVKAERAFSSMGRADSPLRSRLKPATLEMMVICASFLCSFSEEQLESFINYFVNVIYHGEGGK